MKKYLQLLFEFIAFLFILWFIASYVDIITHNTTTHIYNEWNFTIGLEVSNNV